MEMKPLEITKLKCFCETRQGFFLITCQSLHILSLILDIQLLQGRTEEKIL